MAENEIRNDEIRNDELLEAISEMRADFNAKTQSRVINLALRSTFLVPAVVSQNTQLVADSANHLKFQDKPQARFMLVKNKAEQSYFPIFSDMDEFSKMKNDQGFQAVKMKFADIATLTEQSAAKVTGFVINPMSTNLPFNQDMLANIKQTLRDARDKKLAEKAAAEAAESGITATETNS